MFTYSVIIETTRGEHYVRTVRAASYGDARYIVESNDDLRVVGISEIYD